MVSTTNYDSVMTPSVYKKQKHSIEVIRENIIKIGS